MKRRQFMQQAGIVGAGALTAGFDWPWARPAPRHNLLIAGASAIVPYAKLLASHFNETNKNVDIVVDGGSSAAGLLALKRGAIDISLTTRALTSNEEDLDIHTTLIGIDCVAIVVHPDLPVADLSIPQIRSIFEGRILNWKDVGGPDAAIHLYGRTDASTTRKSVEEMLMNGGLIARSEKRYDSADEMTKAIDGDKFGIGYAAMYRVNERVRPVTIAGIGISPTTLMLDQYPLSRPMFLVVKGDPGGLSGDFVSYSLSAPAQKLLADGGLLKVR